MGTQMYADDEALSSAPKVTRFEVRFVLEFEGDDTDADEVQEGLERIIDDEIALYRDGSAGSEGPALVIHDALDFRVVRLP